jgi:hypothetical protein
MTLLDRCLGGSILEPPVQLAKVEIDVDAAADLRSRILDDLLPYQRSPHCRIRGWFWVW